VKETADPSTPQPRISCRSCGVGKHHAPFLKRKAHTRPCPVLRGRKSGYARSKNISTKGPRNRRSLGLARDDKGKGNGSIESGCRTGAFFITLGGPQANDHSGRDDNPCCKRITTLSWKGIPSNPQQNCHPDRSVAEWRDLRFPFSPTNFPLVQRLPPR
jgi:hypothetical protein